MKSRASFFAMAALVGMLSISSVGFADTQQGFSDVGSSDPYAAYIQDLQDKGAVDGTSDGRFDPARPITRAEFVKALVKALNIPLDTGHFHFADMDGHWAAAYVQTAWSSGMVYGTGEYTFSPNAPLKREEAAVIVWRYLKAHGVSPSVETFMLPTTVDEWAREGVAQSMAKKLWGIPFASGTYQDATSREEAAALIDLASKQETTK